jgi:hypothetical protein
MPDTHLHPSSKLIEKQLDVSEPVITFSTITVFSLSCYLPMQLKRIACKALHGYPGSIYTHVDCKSTSIYKEFQQLACSSDGKYMCMDTTEKGTLFLIYEL